VYVAVRVAAFVSRVLHESMLEQIGSRAGLVPSVQANGAMKTVQCRFSAPPPAGVLLRKGGVREFAADCCRDLCQFLAGPPSRSSRAMSEACRLAGNRQCGERNSSNRAFAAVSLPASAPPMVISSTNKGIPSPRLDDIRRMFAE